MHEKDRKFIGELRAWAASDEGSMFMLASVNKTSLPIFKDDILDTMSDEEILKSLYDRTLIKGT